MGILMWLIVGLVAGGVAKLLVPGEDPGGLGTTVLLGMGGAVFGGMVSWMLGLGVSPDPPWARSSSPRPGRWCCWWATA